MPEPKPELELLHEVDTAMLSLSQMRDQLLLYIAHKYTLAIWDEIQGERRRLKVSWREIVERYLRS